MQPVGKAQLGMRGQLLWTHLALIIWGRKRTERDKEWQKYTVYLNKAGAQQGQIWHFWSSSTCLCVLVYAEASLASCSPRTWKSGKSGQWCPWPPCGVCTTSRQPSEGWVGAEIPFVCLPQPSPPRGTFPLTQALCSILSAEPTFH